MAATWKKLAYDSDVVKHSLATAESDFLVAPSSGSFVKKTLAETKAILGLGTNRFVQIQHAQTGDLISGNTVLPCDDTTPQKTEGFEIITCAITPKKATNILLIIANTGYVSAPASPYHAGIALFQDTTADALAANAQYSTGALTLLHKMAAGTTSETTFKVRVGAGAAGTIYVNVFGNTTGRAFGGVNATTLTILEMSP
jgi:hypothetical protein